MIHDNVLDWLSHQITKARQSGLHVNFILVPVGTLASVNEACKDADAAGHNWDVTMFGVPVHESSRVDGIEIVFDPFYGLPAPSSAVLAHHFDELAQRIRKGKTQKPVDVKKSDIHAILEGLHNLHWLIGQGHVTEAETLHMVKELAACKSTLVDKKVAEEEGKEQRREAGNGR